MPQDRNLRLFWLAIGVPAVLFALGGLRLLQAEAHRARESEIAALRLHAEYRAEKYREGIKAAISEMLLPLADAPTRGEKEIVLRTLAGKHKFIKNFNVWSERSGFPPPETFRFERTFDIDNAADGKSAKWKFRTVKVHGMRQISSSRIILPAKPGAASAGSETGVGEWTVDGKSRLVGWLKEPDGDICMLEIDPAAFFADNPGIAADGGDSPGGARPAEYTLLAPGESAGAEGLSAEVSLAPVLNDWRVCAKWKSPAGGSAFALPLAGGCLLALLVCSLFAGGALLVRDARRQRRDALLKTDFVSNVSHELKTPLTSIQLWAELAASDRLPSPDSRKHAVTTILSESKRLSRMVDNLLDFGRLESKRKKFKIAPVPLREAVRAEIDLLAADGDARPVLSDGGEVAALADMDAVRQILANLFSNAAKYAPGSKVEVSAREEGGRAAAVKVRDHGSGIPPGLEEKIFERFFRADDSVTSKTGGSGLGLSIARALARGMGGDLVAANAAGGGAEFVLSLPLAGGTQEAEHG